MSSLCTSLQNFVGIYCNTSFQAILYLCPDDKVDPRLKSGGEAIKRHTSHGTQVFDTDKSVWPLNQPISKLEGLVQCSGEATFANDLPKQPNEVFAAFVTADARPGSVISDFDTTEAFVSGKLIYETQILLLSSYVLYFQ